MSLVLEVFGAKTLDHVVKGFIASANVAWHRLPGVASKVEDPSGQVLGGVLDGLSTEFSTNVS
eukprot:3989259-Pyramimonas_sp.AAC.2